MLPNVLTPHTKDELYSFLKSLVSDPALAPKDGVTYCNFALQRVGKFYNYPYFDGLLADQISQKAVSGEFPSIIKTTGEDAVGFAMKGGLCFAAKFFDPHGHVSVVAPVPAAFSPSWNKNIPVLANVGETNGFIPTSQAFPVSQGEPDYFLLLGSAVVPPFSWVSFFLDLVKVIRKRNSG